MLGQQVECKPGQPGNVQILAPMAIDTNIIAQPLTPEEEEKGRTIKGYRVQVYSGRSRQEASTMKSQLEMSQSQPVYLEYSQPYYKVEVGDYRDKIEVQRPYFMLKEQYPAATIIKKDIQFPRLDGDK